MKDEGGRRLRGFVDHFIRELHSIFRQYGCKGSLNLEHAEIFSDAQSRAFAESQESHLRNFVNILFGEPFRIIHFRMFKVFRVPVILTIRGKIQRTFNWSALPLTYGSR